MWIATNALSYLSSLNPLHSQPRARDEPPKSVNPVTDSETSCSSTNASRRESVDLVEPRLHPRSSIQVDPKEREREQYDARVQGLRLAEYPALRGKHPFLTLNRSLTSSHRRMLPRQLGHPTIPPIPPQSIHRQTLLPDNALRKPALPFPIIDQHRDGHRRHPRTGPAAAVPCRFPRGG